MESEMNTSQENSDALMSNKNAIKDKRKFNDEPKIKY